MEENKKELNPDALTEEEIISEEPAPEIAEGEVSSAEQTENVSEESEKAENEEVSEDGIPEEGETAPLADEEIQDEKKACNEKKIVRILSAVAAVVLIVALTVFLTPRVKYLWAMGLTSTGNYQEAYKVLNEIDGSYDKAKEELNRFIITHETDEYFINYGGQTQTMSADYKYDFRDNYYKKTVSQNGSESVEEYYYDKKGNITKKVTTDSSGSESTIVYTYNKDGKLSEAKVNENGEEYVVLFEYDKNGNQTSEVYKTPDGEEIQSAKLKNYKMQYVKK